MAKACGGAARMGGMAPANGSMKNQAAQCHQTAAGGRHGVAWRMAHGVSWRQGSAG